MESPLPSPPHPEGGGAPGARLGTTPAPQGPAPLTSFIRYVICGGGIGLLAGLAVPLLALAIPWAVANALITGTSTLLCTELHARFTFGTGRRPGRRRHLQSAASATAAYALTSAAMLLLHTTAPAPSLLTQQTVYLSASALSGTARFLFLRLFVFTPHGKWIRFPPTSRTHHAGLLRSS